MIDNETLNPHEARQRVLDYFYNDREVEPQFTKDVDELIRVSQKVAVRDAIGAIQAEFSSLLNK